jgi:hypothetical protein
MCLDLHRDIDEMRGRMEPGEFSFPSSSHVLYVDVADSVGPTVLFDIDAHESSNHGIMSIVHSVNGRLLRFDGSMPHAVPRPLLAWLDPSQGGSNNQIFSRRRNILDTEKRAVLLFNTWNHLPSGLSSPNGAAAEDLNCVCQPIRLWKQQKIYEYKDNPNENEETIRMKIGVLGDGRRRSDIFARGASERYMELTSPRSAKLGLLDELKTRAYSFPLRKKIN